MNERINNECSECMISHANISNWFTSYPSNEGNRSNFFKVDENRIEQCFVAHIGQCCQQYYQPLIQAQQYYPICLNVGGTTLSNPFLSPGRVDNLSYRNKKKLKAHKKTLKCIFAALD